MKARDFVTAGRDAERRLVELLAEVDADTADRVRLRLALGLTAAEVEAARHVDVSRIGGAAFLTVRTTASDRVRVLPLGPLHAAVIEPRARGAKPADCLFPPTDVVATARAFTHAAGEFPGVDEEAIAEHYAHLHRARETTQARRHAALVGPQRTTRLRPAPG